MCVLPLTSTHFFLYILSIFPFFTPFCNRQMKVKKECIEYIRRFKDDEAKRHQETSTTFSFFSLFLFSIYLSFSLLILSLYMIRLYHLVLCVQTTAAAAAGFRPFTTILCRSFFCTLHPAYTI